MTLDEAIKHAEEVLESKCGECAIEHKELAVWLKELKKLKEERATVEKINNVYIERFEKAERENYRLEKRIERYEKLIDML